MDTVLFDLDGTLLPMQQEAFVEGYFSALAKKFIPFGLDSKMLIRGIWTGTKAMAENDGSITNEKRFWQSFALFMGQDILRLAPEFDKFYMHEFNNAKQMVGFTPLAHTCTQLLKDKGYRLIAATNPIFPASATQNRLRWAGVDPNIFHFITTYEHCTFCKPNLGYYREILQKAEKAPGDCLMVGNDVNEDMCAAALGIDTYLITDCLINSKNKDISTYRHGSFHDFYQFVQELPSLNEASKSNEEE